MCVCVCVCVCCGGGEGGGGGGERLQDEAATHLEGIAVGIQDGRQRPPRRLRRGSHVQPPKPYLHLGQLHPRSAMQPPDHGIWM